MLPRGTLLAGLQAIALIALVAILLLSLPIHGAVLPSSPAGAARDPSGEVYGFERLKVLFGTRPSATQASDEALAFGQEDDVTVLTLTRLAAGEKIKHTAERGLS